MADHKGDGNLAAFAARHWGNALAFGGNVLCCVAIVFANKLLMGSRGYGFHFATTLSALHFLVCGVAVLLSQARNKQQEKGSKGGGKLPIKDLLIFTVVADASIITLNLSLLLNPVSTYQIAKLLVIPFVCFVERFFLGAVFSRQVLATIMVVVLGVGIVTVEEVNFDATLLGLLIAGASVVCSGMQQILVRSMQQAHSLTSNEMLAYVAPAQAVSLLLLGPPIDKLVSNEWVFQYQWSVPAINCIALSCALAVGVNFTQFAVLGRFSASTFQVLGHSKTVMVLLGGFLFLGEHAGPQKILGMVMAVTGMVLYGRVSMAGGGKPTPAPRNTTLVSGGGSASDLEEGGEGEKAALLAGKGVAVAANGSGELKDDK